MLTGVILAGGSNQWLGNQLKGLLPFEGEKLIHRQIRKMSEVCQEVILVSDEPKHYLKEVDYPIRIITDYIPGTGPLSGMYASFSLGKRDDLWVVSCDMPFISPKAAQWMLDKKRDLRCEAVIPMLDGIPYPLHGVYDKGCVNAIWKLLDRKQYRLHDLLPLLQWERVTKDHFYEHGLATQFTCKLSTLEEYQIYQQRIKEES
jgi:molybdopterin-guanine dinucleotide biosynthesis protein A